MHYLYLIIILVFLYLMKMFNPNIYSCTIKKEKFKPANTNIYLRLSALNKEEVELIFRNKKEKYLSANDINRHYIITYNDDNTFITDTYENNIKIGESYGTYKINADGTINIKYKYVFSSPNKNSQFHPHNSFYRQLSNYNIGPYYIYSDINIQKNIIDGDVLHIMYKDNQENNPNYLTFYPK